MFSLSVSMSQKWYTISENNPHTRHSEKSRFCTRGQSEELTGLHVLRKEVARVNDLSHNDLPVADLALSRLILDLDLFDLRFRLLHTP